MNSIFYNIKKTDNQIFIVETSEKPIGEDALSSVQRLSEYILSSKDENGNHKQINYKKLDAEAVVYKSVEDGHDQLKTIAANLQDGYEKAYDNRRSFIAKIYDYVRSAFFHHKLVKDKIKDQRIFIESCLKNKAKNDLFDDKKLSSGKEQDFNDIEQLSDRLIQTNYIGIRPENIHSKDENLLFNACCVKNFFNLSAIVKTEDKRLALQFLNNLSIIPTDRREAFAQNLEFYSKSIPKAFFADFIMAAYVHNLDIITCMGLAEKYQIKIELKSVNFIDFQREVSILIAIQNIITAKRDEDIGKLAPVFSEYDKKDCRLDILKSLLKIPSTEIDDVVAKTASLLNTNPLSRFFTADMMLAIAQIPAEHRERVLQNAPPETDDIIHTYTRTSEIKKLWNADTQNKKQDPIDVVD